MSEAGITLGTITVRYWLDGDGEPIVTTDVDGDRTEFPVIVQLGALDLARDAIGRMAADE